MTTMAVALDRNLLLQLTLLGLKRVFHVSLSRLANNNTNRGFKI